MFSFGFYNSKNEDRKYNASHFGKIFDGIIQEGIFGTIKEANKTPFQLEPREPASLSAKINKGKAWLGHTWNLLDSAGILTFDAVNTPHTKRTDAVCIEVNQSYSESGFYPRTNRLAIIKGGSEVSESGPDVRPVLTDKQIKNSAGEIIIWRFPLAYVTIYHDNYPNSSGTTVQYHANVIESVNIVSAIQPIGALDDDKYKTWTPLVTGATMDVTDYIPSLTEFESSLNAMLNNDQGIFNSWFNRIAGSYVGDYVVFSGSAFQSNIVYYELINSQYIPTQDTEPQQGKTYYLFSNAASIEALDTKIDNKILYGTSEPPSTLEPGQVYFMVED